MSAARIAAVALALAAGTAAAHPLAPSLLELREAEAGRVEITWRTPVTTLAGVRREPVLPAACRDAGSRAREATPLLAIERWSAVCEPAGLVGRSIGVTGLDATNSDALLRVSLADGRVVQHVLRSDTERFAVPDRTPRLAIARDYGALGVEHILTGADHLLFVLGLLLLVGGGKPLVQTITAFTLGHSVTLSLAALGVVRFPVRPIEVAIAASVFWLAVELARGEAHGSWLRRAPWLAAASFGLLHGFGFAGMLAETGLPTGEIPLALLSFNLGIEAGQLAFVLALLLPLRLARTRLATAPAWLARAPVYAMGSLAAFWCFERAALLLP